MLILFLRTLVFKLIDLCHLSLRSSGVVLNLLLRVSIIHFFSFIIVVNGASRRWHVISLLTRFLFFRLVGILTRSDSSRFLFTLVLLLSLLVFDTFSEAHGFEFFHGFSALCIVYHVLFQTESLLARLKDESR